MDLKEYLKQYNWSFETVTKDYSDTYLEIKKECNEWLGYLENKLNLINDNQDRDRINAVIQNIKNDNYKFSKNDTENLSLFISKINGIIKIANRLNNFKEGTALDNGQKLELFQLFNTIKNTDKLLSLNLNLNKNLKTFIPHLFSVIKHCQKPTEYPIYYKYWKNIYREILLQNDDYDSICEVYRTFPLENRQVCFASYLGTIGTHIAKNITKHGVHVEKDSKNYKYLTEKVINTEDYIAIIDSQLSNTSDKQNMDKQYWLYAPGENAYKWDEFYELGIMALGWDELEDIRQYKSREEIKDALVSAYGGEGSKKNDVSANDDFVNKINIGDIIIAKKGRGELLGFGEVKSDYIYDENRSDYNSIRKVEWKLKGNWKVDFSLVLKTLTDITAYSSDHDNYDTYYERLLGIMRNENTSTENLEEMNFPLNTILYGPPGTGKTYNTILRAAEIIENRKIDSYSEALKIFNTNLHDRIEFVTFHQNYSYEDFIQGLRPDVENGQQLAFERKDGVFKSISDRALENLISASKAPEEVSKDVLFEKGLDLFTEKVQENDEDYHIYDSVAYISEVTSNAFRYKGENWGTGQLMKFKDLKELYRNNVESRKDIKALNSVSGLAKQHASYFLRVYNEILKCMPQQVETIEKPDRLNYVIIIDEINRANISRVFGELITLIEPDKRTEGDIPIEVILPSGEPFKVPSNLYIIGTMNTADKSIALLDIALRRRFEFESMYPKYEIEGNEIYDVEILRKINDQIIKSKGHDFQIGHAYFMGENKDLVQRMNKKVIPLLLEYYMNDEKEVSDILKNAGLKVEEKSWPLKIAR